MKRFIKEAIWGGLLIICFHFLAMYKQTIVMRADLNMGRGKIAAQCSHSSLTAYERVLKVGSEQELFEYFQKAKDAGIPVELIRDAGHTQIEPGTVTCFAAGPWDEKQLDAIFGELKLL
jgi:PTH2 family peptidyl-tRNA hydrolase